jgi:hypothetical protein
MQVSRRRKTGDVAQRKMIDFPKTEGLSDMHRPRSELVFFQTMKKPYFLERTTGESWNHLAAKRFETAPLSKKGQATTHH